MNAGVHEPVVRAFSSDGTACRCHVFPGARALLVQPSGAHEAEREESELLRILRDAKVPFAMAFFDARDWDADLTPWEAPAAFGGRSFGNGASRTLRSVLESVIPDSLARAGLKDDVPVVLGGYSLAGLFALWSIHQTDRFSAAAAVSPSVWYPGWTDYADRNKPRTGIVYLSLGDREEKTKNRTIAAVGDAIRRQDGRLEACGIRHVLRWNPGGHFSGAEERCADGFVWCLEQLFPTPEK